MAFWRTFISAILLLTPVSALRAEEAPGRVVERVVAVVNGKIVLFSDLGRNVAKMEAEMKGKGAEAQTGTREETERKVLDQMIDEILVGAETERRGLSVTDSTVDSAIASVMKQNNMKSTADLERALKNEGLTMDAYRSTVKRQIETSRLLNEAIRPRIQVTDQDAENEYRRSAGERKAGELYKLRMIFKKKSGPRSDLKSMGRLERQIKAGVPFERVADRETDGAGKGDGGMIGAVSLGDLQPELAKAVKNLKPGEVSGVIVTNQGSYIVQFVEPAKAETRPLTDTEKTEIREKLIDRETQQQFDSFVRDLRNKAQIEVTL
jgi:peptidyl-prolyl cis-trans isomerase SurA